MFFKSEIEAFTSRILIIMSLSHKYLHYNAIISIDSRALFSKQKIVKSHYVLSDAWVPMPHIARIIQITLHISDNTVKLNLKKLVYILEL